MKVGIIRTKNRNDSISIGALVIEDELTLQGIVVEYCDYEQAHNFTHVLVSMTSTTDIFDIYASCKKNNWDKRNFMAYVGGFGCQNPVALAPFIDYAFFGRVDGIILDFLQNPDKYSEHSFKLTAPHLISLRQVLEVYPNPVRYGKNNGRWQEKIIGCPFRCKFCHYSHNRKYVGNGGYMNDQISGCPEVMLKDITSIETKTGRLTAALDGYSERLRFKWGKKITWDMVEEAMDHLASFKGSTIFKLYNIHNLPTETEADREEFNQFWLEYVACSKKADGCVMVDIFNTAFRPSINTPMERCQARLYPEARPGVLRLINKNGFIIKYTPYIQGAWAHLYDLISIRYSNPDVIEYVSEMQILKGNKMIDEFNHHFDIDPYIREYTSDEPLPFKWIK